MRLVEMLTPTTIPCGSGFKQPQELGIAMHKLTRIPHLFRQCFLSMPNINFPSQTVDSLT
jgi:hypothetical protein